MEPSFKLTTLKPLSKASISKGYSDFKSVFNYIKALPYGRPSNRSDFTLVLTEEKGTCSTKHAFLKAIAIENDFEDLELCLGIFKMNVENTPKIKTILEQHQLSYIPEAHCYLKLVDKVIDITFRTPNETSFVKSLLHEETILPEHIGAYKVNLHKSYLKSWIETEHLPLSFDELWTIRETCISAISE